MPFAPGDTFDRYTIEALLGEGGMGQVYRAFDPRLQRRVALKVLRDDQARGPDNATEASARMMREARAAAALEHANCVAIFDVGEVQGIRFIAMEYIDGSSLRRFIGDPAVPLDLKLRWMVDVARALRAAHRRGLVHRDIKPENVMVREDGAVKVLDFGIAKRALGDDKSAPKLPSLASLEENTTTTAEGSISGTPQYMAPEQLRGEVLDGRADQFAWGLVAYELITGHHPWRRDKETSNVLLGILSVAPMNPSTFVPSLPSLVEATIVKALAKSPSDRFASMDSVVSALEPYATGSQRSMTAAGSGGDLESVKTELAMPMPPRASRAPRPSRSMIAGGIAVIALATIGIATAIRSSDRSGDANGNANALDASPLHGIAATAAEMPSPRNSEALAAFREGLQSFRDASFETARQAFARAVGLDATFAAAHLRLAILASLIANESDARQSFERAVQYRSALTARDRALLDAIEPYLQREPSDLGESVKRLRAAADRFANDAEIRLYLGTVQFDAGLVKEAAATFEAALDLDPDFAEASSYLGATLAFLGDFEKALPALDRCLAVSSGATDCLWYRVLIHEQQGGCALVEADARSWIAKSPGDPYAYHALAKALFALGRDESTVRLTLAQKWARVDMSTRARVELEDETRLDVANGNFTSALARTREIETILASEPSSAEHARVATWRVDLDSEMGRLNDAAEVASAYLAHKDAWVAQARVDDVAISMDRTPHMLAAMMRGKAIAPSAFEARRAEWLRTWSAKTSPTYLGYLWIYGYAAAVATRDDAEAALVALPKYAPLPPFNGAALSPDADLGMLYLLADRAADAVPPLTRATLSCIAMDEPLAHVHAEYALGLAQEKLGGRDAACASFHRVIAAWGNAKPRSTTAEGARESIRRLGCSSR